MGRKRCKRNYYHFSRNPTEYLNKRYDFAKCVYDKLPATLYSCDKWLLPELQERKLHLNSVKEKLSEFNLEHWSRHTKRRDPSTTIIRAIRSEVAPELLTQAWCKFYECLNKFNIIPTDYSFDSLRSVHLCEAPGGFISALNHFLSERFPDVKLDWTANSLNPYYEGNPLNRMIPDDRLIRQTLPHWNFGLDFTGDITTFYNHEYLTQCVCQKGKVFLVTADGSIDCMLNPGDQEKSVEYLLYCETITALSILQLGGRFILKIFTMFEESTVCLLYLLNVMFTSVSIFKPCTSKSGNSELYVICLEFKGYELIPNASWASLREPYKLGTLGKSLFNIDQINPLFMQQVFDCSALFMKYQISTIESNICDFVAATKENVNNSNRDICSWFQHSYNIKTLPTEKRLVTNYDLNLFHKSIPLHDANKIRNRFPLVNLGNVELKFCKKIAYVYNSRFCEIDCLHIQSERPPCSPLVINSLNALKSNNTVISLSLFQEITNFDDFQIAFFKYLRQCLEIPRDVILYKIPLFTHFLVTVVYIMQTGFGYNLFTNCGIIYLKSFNECDMVRVRTFFDLIENELNDVKNAQHGFVAGLYTVLEFSKIDKTFIRCLQSYNKSLIKKVEK